MTNPPKLAQWLLGLVLHAIDHDSVLGDLEETYRYRAHRHGVTAARRWYWYQVIGSLLPLISRSFYWSFVMFKNYLVIALRTLRKQMGYSFINIFGLAAGLACFILILVYVQHEFSYDRFYENSDQIHRIVQRQPGNVYIGSDRFAVTPIPLASALMTDYPEVTSATLVRNRGDLLLSLDDQHYLESGIEVDDHFFEVFKRPLLRGQPETALAAPESIVLTEPLAQKIFGNMDPLGKTLRYQNDAVYTVTGVVPALPDNSSFRYSFIASILSSSMYERGIESNRWNNNNVHTFFELDAGTDAAAFQTKMPQLVETYIADEDEDPGEWNQYFVEALTDIHLGTFVNFDIDEGQKGSITYVYLFLVIAFVILLLACINYMNLAVARSIKRAREVGLRKVVGAARRQLVGQFLGESVLMTALALVLGLVMVHVLLPVFGYLVERPLQLDYVENGLLLPGLLLLIIVVGLLSGSYPALFMASVQPMDVLKNRTGGLASRFGLQRLLIVGQYTASIILIACGFVIYQQLRYVQDKDAGYDREQVVTIDISDAEVRQNYETIREEFLRNPQIMAVTSSGHLPTNIASSTTLQSWEGRTGDNEISIYQTSANYDVLDVFGIELVAGRTFSRDMATDAEEAYLINETAARAFGWTPEEAVGKHLDHNSKERTVIGVMRDFHMHSMHLAIQPLMMTVDPGWMQYISVKVSPVELPETIAFMEQTIKRFSPYPFEYQFLDQHFDQLYKDEQKLGQTFGFFTILALLIASLGLFGLAAYAAERRTKEVGIRKVLGASIPSIVVLQAKEFLRLVAFALLVAMPIAYLLMNRWLESFAYHVEIGAGLFIVTGLLTMTIAVLAVSYQSVKAALADPVNSLRYE